MDARSRLFGNAAGASSGEMSHAGQVGEDEGGSNVKIGARMAKHQIEFIPGGGEKNVSAEYCHLLFVEAEPDYSELTLFFSTHTVTVTAIEGQRLKGLMGQIKAHIVDEVPVAKKPDPLHAKAGLVDKKTGPSYPVASIRVERVEG